MRKALITGTSRGIGKVIKDFFEKKGIFVYAPTRNEMNLSSMNSIKKYISKISDIDILINCAGINELGSLEEISNEKLQEMIQVNLLAQTMLIKYLSAGMKKNHYGRIVNFASIWCEYSKERRIMYSIAKSGIKGLTTSTAVELAKYNVLVNAVAPGFVNTEMTYQNNTLEQINALTKNIPIKRIAEPEEIAKFVYFLASEQNSYIVGQTIFIDGGFSCV